MTFDQWLLFLPAAFALNVFPGPNNLLSLSNGARYGFSAAFTAGFGRLPAFAVMVALTAIGLGALLSASEAGFLVVKTMGAFYLFYLGVRMIAAKPRALSPTPAELDDLDLKSLWRQDFFVASSNPKAIAIFTAFFPQFIQPGEAVWPQLLIMGSVFIIMEVAAIAIYAVFGARLRTFAQSERNLAWINRGSGGALIAAGLALLLSQRAAAS